MKKFILLLVVGLLFTTSVSAAEFNADLRYGVAKNAEVTKLQKFLTAEKLYSGPITGNFYSLTLKAVKAFQAREKIPTSGLVDALTRAQLNDLIAKRPLDNSVSAPSSAAEFNADLRYGVAKNAEVTKLQKFLTAEKLYSGPITGNFYSLTLKAVKAFQAREKIPTSGLVDALTRAQLNDLIAKRPLDNYVKTPNLFKDNGFEKEFTISDTDVKISKVKPIAGKASLQLSLKNKKVVSLDQTITNLPPSKATVLTMTAEVRPDIKSITNVQLCGVAIYSDKTQASECVTLPKIINKISTISVIVPLVSTKQVTSTHILIKSLGTEEARYTIDSVSSILTIPSTILPSIIAIVTPSSAVVVPGTPIAQTSDISSEVTGIKISPVTNFGPGFGLGSSNDGSSGGGGTGSGSGGGSSLAPAPAPI